MPWRPSSTTATCVQVLSGNDVVVAMACAESCPSGAIAQRTKPDASLGVRINQWFVSRPKSKMRCQESPPRQFTQPENVWAELTPGSRLTYWPLLDRFSTLPCKVPVWMDAPPMSTPLKRLLSSRASIVNEQKEDQ